MPRYQTKLTPRLRRCRTCKELKDSETDFYAPSGVTPRPDCKPCANAVRQEHRKAAMATDEGRARRREQWRRDKARARARALMEPSVLEALDAKTLKAKEAAKSRREAFARFRLADALREDRMRIAQGAAYVPRGMRAPWAANSKRRRALGKTPAEAQAAEKRWIDAMQPKESWKPRDFADIEAVRKRHRQQG